MKKKVATYILLPVVIGIWGFVIVKVFDMLSPNDNVAVQVNQTTSVFLPKTLTRDTFSIIANYRDPFSGRTMTAKNTIKKSPQKKKIPQRKVMQKTINWSFIDYGGVLSNNKSKEELALINIHKQSYLMKKGEVQHEVTLLRMYKDSVSVSYQGVSKTIKK